MKVTFNNGYYIVKTETREAQYREDDVNSGRSAEYYANRIKHLQRSLDDLAAIEQYITDQSP